jgi:DNA modification methylase
VDAVITSPPYLNKIEYTKVYSIEEELFFRERSKPALRSYIGMEEEKMLQGEERLAKLMDTGGLPASAIAYFSDMHVAIEEMHRVCKPGARLGIVIGNGCFPSGVVDSDVILSKIAEKVGFDTDEILVLNKRWCTRNRVEKVGMARESLLLWKR